MDFVLLAPFAWRRRRQPFEAGGRSQRMVDRSERSARLLVRALYRATDGERRWWVSRPTLTTKKQSLSSEAGCSIEATVSV